ncbi:LCP family protein [Salisediminibacterium halotolerans]|uniref:Cell envelope-related function transcriptional attenuator common domain-containing protein n=1 Tax=Salisediminibacterium halotolerans TaxID=517425 RepID=A0A1H9TWI2_9BACI|nr:MULTISPECIES: LCP family protein [Salisediminibacterium]RLJ75591.1 LytR family transcriptional attenuator [Actinophytocola xinjiangensis]RPE89445.1 LytR family transcriptional attenuator [Salisediminibacterium halotolerans]TWG36204.1 LytR family transcriptional attenuator [Salisediminibacterium halotolerans]SES01391.1 cell envelope-related function transcriptional attenuator common domain-containing protein [Salisediminibacterium haloalkalitolerans]GEL08189.1 transcriptional regulator LytR 
MTENYSRSERRERPRRKSKWKLALLAFIGFILLAGSGIAYIGFSLQQVTSDNQTELNRGNQSDLREMSINPSDDPVSVLFLGLDSRDGDLSGRTDAMVLASFNPEDDSVQMLNIPRDSRVPIPGYGEDKINHAHAYGGVDLTIETVESYLDIPIDYVISLNFDAFMDIIDTMGGVTVDVPMDIADTDNATYGTVEIAEGRQTLDGEEALAYVRMRKDDPRGDLGRGDRQKDVLEALMHEVSSLQTLTRFNSFVDALDDNLSTNLRFSQIISMHGYAGELNNIDQFSFDGEDTTINGVYYYQIYESSREEVSDKFKQHLQLTGASYAAE